MRSGSGLFTAISNPTSTKRCVCFHFFSYECALTSNFTLIQNPNTAVVASASAEEPHSSDPPVNSSFAPADTSTNCASNATPSVQGVSSAPPEGSSTEASPLTSIPAPSTAPNGDSESAEPTPNAPQSWVAGATPKDSDPACADPDEVSETPALLSSGRTSNDANRQETEAPSNEISHIPQSTVELSSGHADTSEKQ